MERNYAEDQANEVEALESIYCDDIEGTNCTFHHKEYTHIFFMEKNEIFINIRWLEGLFELTILKICSVEHKSTQIWHTNINGGI